MFQRDREPHVAFYTQCWPPGVIPNGIVTYVSNLRRGLEKLGVDTRILTPTIGVGGTSPDVFDVRQAHNFEPFFSKLKQKIHRRISPWSAATDALGRSIEATLRRLDREWGVDVFEIEESFGLAHHPIQAAVAPVVVRLHGPWFLTGRALGEPEDAQFRRRTRLEARAIVAADAISAPSKDVLDRVRAEFELELPEAEVIPNPAPLVKPEDRWTPQCCEPNSVLFVGRFDRLKGGDIAIDAFRLVCQRHPDAKLLFAGPDRGFRDSDGRMWRLDEYLAARVPEPEIRKNIQVLGPVPHDGLPQLRRRASVTVVASRYETFSITTIEAMAFGTPVITSNVGGIAEMVKSERNVLVFETENAEDLARALSRLLRDPELAAQLGDQAGRDCEQRFSPTRIAEQMREFYIRVTQRTTRRLANKKPWCREAG